MRKLVTSQTSIAPLAVFRALFGAVMLASIVRFAAKGWIGELYVEPTYFFSYYGFEWVAAPGEAGMYALFLIMAVAAAGIMLGRHYRVAALVFFLTFTYVELIDKTNYLNHYYFVSIISFLLIWVPANRRFSLDVRKRPELRVDTVPAWTVNIFKLQLGLVYFFAGLAKLHPEWLLDAMPLALWLPAHAHLPIVGGLLEEPLTAYALSWAGAAYDLTIVFFLMWSRTRVAAYAAVVVFHLTTALLFPIGMFPYIMILCTLIFFPAAFHERVIGWMQRGGTSDASPVPFRLTGLASSALATLMVLHFTLQILLPLRAFTYPGELFWTEEGYRFSWRVMLMEKAGHAVFKVRDPATGRQWEVANWEHLTRTQEKMMSTQPDMILQFAHYLEDHYREQGLSDVAVTAEAHVTLNGRRSRLLVDPAVDLTEIEAGLRHKTWILPLEDRDDRWIGRLRGTP
ncbi:MAG: HTTM domain-containing protein [Rhodothermales bacterium]